MIDIASTALIFKGPRLDANGTSEIAPSSTTTIDLVDAVSVCTEVQLQPADAEKIGETEEVNEKPRIEALRQRALLAQRKANKAHLCCNYYTGDLAMTAGLTGLAEFGESHLCLRCRGADVDLEDDDDDDDDIQHAHLGLQFVNVPEGSRSRGQV